MDNFTLRMIAGTIFAVVGLIALLMPRLLWKMQYWWAVSRNSEPSKIFIISMRVVGVILCIGAVLMFVGI